MIKRCLNAALGTCKSKYQDKRYGKGMRVHNERPPREGRTPPPRCAVCGREN